MPDFLPADVCPLVTPYTRRLGITDSLLERLFRVRQWDTENGPPIPFTWPSRLRHTAWDTVNNCDSGVPFELKQYQLQQIHNMVRMRRFINGDSVGLGKTIMTIASLAVLFEQNPHAKVILFCTKSTFFQWTDEIRRFSTLRPENLLDRYKQKTSYEAHFEQLRDFYANDDADILICRYTSMIGKRRKVEGDFDEDGYRVREGRESISREIREAANIVKPHGASTLMVLDESQKFKQLGNAINILVQKLQKPCAVVWPLTATAIKNDLLEFYTIAASVGITPFGSVAEFEDEFCIYRDVHVGRGIQKRTLQGYRNLAKFKHGMRPFFLGRSQAQVKEKLPRLTTVIHPIDLDKEQRRLLLNDIPKGIYKLPPRIFRAHGREVVKERDPENLMTQLSVYRLVANSIALLDPTDQKKFLSRALSPKEEALLDLLDGDLRGEKVIVFTEFRKHIDRLEALNKAGHFSERKFLRITGAENVVQRGEARKLFQDPNSGYDVIYINTAGIEGVNLQQAGHMICLDLPFSWGSLLQLVGRMLRLASPHSACTLHILTARGSIDEFTISTLKSKKGVFEMILGESHTAGLLGDGDDVDLESGMEKVGSDEEFRNMARAHAKEVGMKVFLDGEPLAAAGEEEDYKMVFEAGAKHRKAHRPEDDEDLGDMFDKWE